MRRFGDIPGKHFAVGARRVPASWGEAGHRLRLGLAEYLSFVVSCLSLAARLYRRAPKPLKAALCLVAAKVADWVTEPLGLAIGNLMCLLFR